MTPHTHIYKVTRPNTSTPWFWETESLPQSVQDLRASHSANFTKTNETSPDNLTVTITRQWNDIANATDYMTKMINLPEQYEQNEFKYNLNNGISVEIIRKKG